jgi:type IV pilus assembly protein PilQ
VRSLDTQTPQVLIEARIVEAGTSFTSAFGIQWGGDVVMSSATGNPTGLVFPHDLTVAGGATDGQAPVGGLSPWGASVNPNFVVNMPAPVGTGRGGAIGISMGSIGGNVNFALRLSAYETTGTVRIVSAPRVLTLDNHAAMISQGTSIPYSQVGAQGVQTTFREALLSLDVTPHVTNDGAVSMDVKINRNEPDFNQRSARGDPTILKRQAQTTLLVQDGHTAVIGGIYTRNSGSGFDQVPFLGDIPILGALFHFNSKRDARSELLIFLTPRIVNRGEALNH